MLADRLILLVLADPADPAEPSMPSINPPAGYSNLWWLVAIVALLGLAVLWWRTGRVLGEEAEVPAVPTPADLQAATLTALSGWEQAVQRGEATEREALAGFSAEVRRFVGILTESDADYSTLPRLRRQSLKDPRLVPVVDYLEWLSPMLFDLTVPVDLPAAAGRAREVVGSWS